jgi:hypothetical protein
MTAASPVTAPQRPPPPVAPRAPATAAPSDRQKLAHPHDSTEAFI